ncbi:MAG: 2-C-methyl-D-erythritol 2,4-cyclodiphosphate synthase [Nocardiopsis sp. BM-2018]|nr:MAG: 2-C-methyl-D-erythritol 2,4-cyclodiphosphate synthase [Nocardiopsis sp. BM-2018]
MPTTLVGHGLDAHRLATGRALVLGGHAVPDAPRGAQAHSDGDVLLHALADALLATLGLGDIGDAFPPSDPAWRDLDSRRILEHVLARLGERAPGARLVNVAAVVVLDAPRLGPQRASIQAALAEQLGLRAERVGVTFKTSEGLAPDHVQASVTVLLELP